MNINEQTAEDIKKAFWRILYQNQEKWKIEKGESFDYFKGECLKKFEISYAFGRALNTPEYKDFFDLMKKQYPPQEYEECKKDQKWSTFFKEFCEPPTKGFIAIINYKTPIPEEELYKSRWETGLINLCKPEIKKRCRKKLLEEIVPNEIRCQRILGYEYIEKGAPVINERGISIDVKFRKRVKVRSNDFKDLSFNKFKDTLNRIDVLLNVRKPQEIKNRLLIENKIYASQFEEIIPEYLWASRQIEEGLYQVGDINYSKAKERCYLLWHYDTMIKTNQYIINTLCKTPSKVPA